MLQACFQTKWGGCIGMVSKQECSVHAHGFILSSLIIEQVTQCAGLRAKQQMHFGTGENTGFFPRNTDQLHCNRRQAIVICSMLSQGKRYETIAISLTTVYQQCNP